MRLTHRVVEGQVTRALRLVVQEARLQPVASVLGVVPVARAERWLLRGSLNAQATAQLDPFPHKRHNYEHLLKLQMRSARSTLHPQRSLFCTGFVEVPWAFCAMMDSSPITHGASNVFLGLSISKRPPRATSCVLRAPRRAEKPTDEAAKLKAREDSASATSTSATAERIRSPSSRPGEKTTEHGLKSS